MTPAPDLVLRARRAVLPGGVGPAAIHVAEGRISAVLPGREGDAAPPGAPVVDCGDALLMPGLVDTHVHVNEPGRAEWEGFATATRAAAAGGVTTLVDMPLNAVPATTTVQALRRKREAAAGQCTVDVGFWGGVVPGNEAALAPLWEAGVLGFKCFLSPSGVDEFESVDERALRRALPVLAELGAPLLVHAELPAVLERGGGAGQGADPRAYATWLRSRPPEAEVEAVRLLVRLARETGARVHVVHVASSAALGLLRDARAEGLPLSAETCPHYLHFAAEEIPDAAVEHKCAPPIRERAEREALWRGLEAGDLDLVASDHSPCPPALKAGDWFGAWGGIASLQVTLPVVWSGARARGIAPERLAEWMSAAPARLAGLQARKGSLEVGRDADLVVWEPDAPVRVDAASLHHRHPATPYAGCALSGAVRETYVRGVRVFERGRFPAGPAGLALERPPFPEAA